MKSELQKAIRQNKSNEYLSAALGSILPMFMFNLNAVMITNSPQPWIAPYAFWAALACRFIAAGFLAFGANMLVGWWQCRDRSS